MRNWKYWKNNTQQIDRAVSFNEELKDNKVIDVFARKSAVGIL